MPSESAPGSDLLYQDRAVLIRELERVEAELATRTESKLKSAQTRITAFCEYVLRDEKTNEPIKLDAMHRLWFNFIWSSWKRGLHPFILAPFGSGKTHCISVALPLFLLGRDQQIRIKLLSASDDIAMERVKLQRQYIETSEPYHDVFPHVVPDPERGWRAKEFTIKRGSRAKDASVFAVGASSSVQGSRSDLLIVDDLNDLRNTLLYPKLRKTTWRNFTFLLSRLEQVTGRFVGIMTRWHTEDTFGLITRDAQMFHQYSFLIQAISDDFQSLECEIVMGRGGRPVVPFSESDPMAQVLAEFDESWVTDGGEEKVDVPGCRNEIPWAADAAVHQHRRLPLWDLRFTPDSLRAREAEMGKREFDRGYRQKAISDQDLLWKESYIANCLDKTHFAVSAVLDKDRWDTCARYAGVDLAISTENKEAAFFVIFVLAVDAEGHRWPLWMVRERNLSFGHQIELIRDIHTRFRLTKLVVESNAYQDSVRQHLGVTTDIPITGFKTGAIEKRDVEVGLPSLAVEYEHKKWHIPQGDAQSQRVFQPLLEELATYPNARYDDCIMAMLFARSAAMGQQGPSPRVFVLRF